MQKKAHIGMQTTTIGYPGYLAILERCGVSWAFLFP